MKKLLTYLFTLCSFALLVPSFAYAATAKTVAKSSATPLVKASAAAVKAAAKQASLKERADTEIDRRIAGLNELVTRLGNMKHLSPDSQTELSTKIQTQISDLTALKTKIDAETDAATIKADVKSIVDSYHIFVVFMPQVHLLAASDSINDVATQLDALVTKLEARITADTNTANVTAMNTSLTDMRSMIADAKTQASSVQTTIAALTPEGYPANKADMTTARAAVKKGYQDLQTARKDAAAIVKILKSEKPAEATPSPTTSATPAP